MTHCNEFTRSQLLRNAVAKAGDGLPRVEAGCPTPAGTGLSRRSMLLRSAGLALSVYGANAVGSQQMFEGVEAAAAAAPDAPVLITVFAGGGWDSQSVLAPVRDSVYQRSRPTLAIAPNDALRFSQDDRLQWHGSLAGLKTLHGEGKVTTFPGIGYASPNFSHFTSRHFWEVGDLDVGGKTGWLGRYVDSAGSPDNPLQGLSLSSALMPTLASARNPVAALLQPRDFGFPAPQVNQGVNTELFNAWGRLGSGPETDVAMQNARRVTRSTSDLRTQLAPFSSGSRPASYPVGLFAEQMSSVAAMLGAGLPLRAVSVNAPGNYDTHGTQAGTLGNHLQDLDRTLLAFQRDIEARGLANRVLVLLWSEFGRRTAENGSRGTEHGAGGVGFLVGSRASGQLEGEYPGTANVDPYTNLLPNRDFRSVYCSLLEGWLGVDAGPIIPGADRFPRLSLIR